ncbi:DUF2292 domain-containing protein [Lysobacter sp. CA196]|uniref:DUF2292 domain-containing protein n=1 Tax=Lysobacter sp. CA196 TaxID=3455606 RepID=UPI003F8D141F
MSRRVPGERGAGQRESTEPRRRERAIARQPNVDAARPEPAVDPEINIVNLSDSEYQLLSAVRELGQGQIEVVVHSSRIVQITRSQRLPVTPTRAPRP